MPNVSVDPHLLSAIRSVLTRRANQWTTYAEVVQQFVVPVSWQEFVTACQSCSRPRIYLRKNGALTEAMMKCR